MGLSSGRREVSTTDAIDSLDEILYNVEVIRVPVFFIHTEAEDGCFYDPKSSHVHQTACENAIRTFCTRLDCDRSRVEFETEVRKDSTMTGEMYSSRSEIRHLMSSRLGQCRRDSLHSFRYVGISQFIHQPRQILLRAECLTVADQQKL
jgi:hypothetical protein